MSKAAVWNRLGRVPLGLAVLCFGVVTACAGDTTTKAGGHAEPVRLTVGVRDPQASPTADQMDELVREAASRSDGAVELDPQYGVESADWDRGLIEKVRSGELDMVVIASRAWDLVGVDTFRPLQAPFLIDSDDALDALAVDEAITDPMLAGLDALGVTGLALTPENLRHVFSFGDAMLTPADFDRVTVRVPTSEASADLFRALGAATVGLPDADAFVAALEDGEVQAAESAFAFAGTLARPTVVVGNLTPYPKLNTIVVNTAAFERLSDDQQAALRDASIATRDWAVANRLSDAAHANGFCDTGGTVVLADENQIQAFRDATEPVYEALRADATTATLLDRITEVVSGVEPGDTVRACAPPSTPDTTIAADVPDTATSAASAPDASAVADAAFAEGVYRYHLTIQDGLDAGLNRADATNLAGVWELTFADGTMTVISVGDASGGRAEDHFPYCVEDDRFTSWASADHTGCARQGEFSTARWELDGDELRFIDVELHNNPDPADDTIVPAIWGNHPWLRIGDAPVTATETSAPASTVTATDASSVADATFPEGVYRYQLTVQGLTDAGLDRATATADAGTMEMTIAGGETTIVFVSDATGERIEDHGVYCVEGGRITLGFPDGRTECVGFWSARWELDGDELRFVNFEVQSPDPRDDTVGPAIFASHPWLRIGDVPSATDTTAGGVDTVPTAT